MSRGSLTRQKRREPPNSTKAFGIVTDRIAREAPRLYDLFEKAEGYAHDHKDTPTDELGKRISTSGLANPTESIATTQEYARRKCGQAAAKVQRADNLLADAADILEEVFREPFKCLLCSENGLTYVKVCRVTGEEHEEDLEPLAAYKNQTEEETKANAEAIAARRKRQITAELDRLQSVEARLRIRQESLRRERDNLG